MTNRQTYQTTDQPVIGRPYSAFRLPTMGHWLLYQFAMDENGMFLELQPGSQKCVVNDHGELMTLSCDQIEAHYLTWVTSEAVGVAEQEQLDHQQRVQREALRAAEQRERTRDLLRPPPVTVEITTEHADEWNAADIVIGHDPRFLDVPAYTVRVGGHDTLRMTHAQLAALLVAAQQLCKPAKGAAGALQ